MAWASTSPQAYKTAKLGAARTEDWMYGSPTPFDWAHRTIVTLIGSCGPFSSPTTMACKLEASLFTITTSVSWNLNVFVRTKRSALDSKRAATRSVNRYHRENEHIPNLYPTQLRLPSLNARVFPQPLVSMSCGGSVVIQRSGRKAVPSPQTEFCLLMAWMGMTTVFRPWCQRCDRKDTRVNRTWPA